MEKTGRSWMQIDQLTDEELETWETLATSGNEELVEGNNWNDTYWGVCKGVGENHLGKILIRIRDGLDAV